MGTVMKASEFVNKLKDVALNYKTLYVMGCFGAPMTAKNKARYTQNNDYNKQAARTAMIQAASADTFGFDCVCLLKGILWGWSGDKSKNYGGAAYASNGVKDIGADGMIKVCSGVSTDFSHVEVGEALWCSGHIGVYIGDGLGVECTPAWKNKVQITAVANIGPKAGYASRKWTKHGKLPYIEYDVATGSTPVPVQTPAPSTGKVSGTISTGSAADEKAIWNFLFSKLGNEYAAAGIMGNMYAESGLRSNNLQNSYEAKLGFTDSSYTAAVDNGTYGEFAKDAAGYGLCQWTYWSRKESLLRYAREKGRSVGDLETQLEFLMKELASYGLIAELSAAKSVAEASNVFLLKFEKPASKDTAATQSRRAAYSQKYYAAYASGKTGTATPSTPVPAPVSTKVDTAKCKDKALTGRYKVTAAAGLHIRTGASTTKASLGVLPAGSFVNNYGYYNTGADGVVWLYVKTGTGVIGYCSSRYLVRE